MSLAITSLLNDQALSFVLTAAAICAFSAWLLVRLFAQTEQSTRESKPLWLIATAVIAGTGVWTTHFVAMLGYRTDLVLSYGLERTLVSALMAIFAVGVPLAISTLSQQVRLRTIAGGVSGVGIGIMHIAGMSAVQGCAQSQSVVVNVIACVTGAACMSLARGLPNRINPPLLTATLIVIAVCGTHFVSISGTLLTSDSLERVVPASHVTLSIFTAAGALILLVGAFIALIAANRFDTQEQDHALVLATALQNMSNGILKISRTEIIELFNDRLCSMLRLHPESIFRGMSLAAFLSETGRANGWDEDRITRVLANHRDWMACSEQTSVEHSFDDGRIFSIVCQPVADGAVLTFDDITSSRLAQREISHLAFHDPLTGLANRRSLQERMVISYAVGETFTLLLLDLDRFKAVNDSYGHGVGDQLLVCVAERLCKLIGESDFAFRLGGDEMAVIVSLPCDIAMELAVRIVTAIEQPYTFNGFEVVIGCSIGVCGDNDAGNSDDLMQRADIALYEAKRHGRGRAVRYEAGMIEAVAERHLLENDMRIALTERQFHLAYQPIMSLVDDTVIGFEALIRWHHPTRGSVSPVNFIPLAEETRLIVPIGQWVIEEACREAMAWPTDQHVAVNVSAVQLRSPMFLHYVTFALSRSGLPAYRLEIELTETALVEDGRQLAHTLAALRQLGIKIAMDDFGTGYSSFAHLRDLPLDRIKIDRSFVSAALDDPHSMAVIRAITQMGRDMNIETLAEGIEDEAQLNLLRSLGCDAVQGYLIGRPTRPCIAAPSENSAVAA